MVSVSNEQPVHVPVFRQKRLFQITSNLILKFQFSNRDIKHLHKLHIPKTYASTY